MKRRYLIQSLAMAVVILFNLNMRASGSPALVLNPDNLTNTLVVAGESLTRTMVISNTGNSDLEFSFCPPPPKEDDNGLVAYYPFNGNANDESGNGHDGIEKGTFSYGVGFDGSSAKFNGTDTFIEIPHSDALSLNGKFSISVWVKSNDTNPYSGLVSKILPNVPRNGYTLGANYVSTGSDIYMNQYKEWGNIAAGVRSSSDVLNDEWHHVTATYDEQNFRLFIDGQLETQKTYTGGLTPNTMPLFLGRDPYNAVPQNRHYNGEMDELRIYNRVLSENEISGLYTSADDGLVAHYPFNGNASDESGNGHDGPVVGTTLTADRFGNPDSAYVFDGLNDYINLGAMGGFKTVSMWVNQSTRTDTDFYFGHRDFKVFAYTSQDGILLMHDSTSGPRALASTISIDDYVEQWVHVVAISDGLDSKIYFNGENVALDPRNLSSVSDSIVNLGRWPGGRHYFNGKLDDIYVYDRVLSEAEILQLYAEGSVAECVFPEWLSVEPKSGTIPPGASGIIDVTFSATGMVAGDYVSHQLDIFSTDLANNPLIVPASMWVTPKTPVMTVEPNCSYGKANELFWSRQGGPVQYWIEATPSRHCAPSAHGDCSEESHGKRIPLGWLNTNRFDASWNQDSGWITPTNFYFGGLRLNTQYSYRTKAGVQTDIGLLESAWSVPETSCQIPHVRNGKTIVIPDEWKLKHFDSMADCNAQGDCDNDGLSNLDEYITGHDPRDRNSKFKVHGRKAASDEAYILEWECVPGRLYNVYWCESLGDQFELIQEGIRYPKNNYKGSSLRPSGFYRLEVLLDE